MTGFTDTRLTIHDLVNGNINFIDEYIKIYQALFPKYTRYVPVMRQRAKTKTGSLEIEKWHQWLLMIDDRPAGIVGFIYNRKRNLGLLMDFAIYPEFRKLKFDGALAFSHFVLNLAMQQLVEDAKENSPLPPICLAAEVEYPALLDKYKGYGYVEFAVEYFEPPSTPELEKVNDKIEELSPIKYERMHIGAFQIPGHVFDKDDSEIVRTVLFAFLEDHYRLPLNHWLVQKIIHEASV